MYNSFSYDHSFSRQRIADFLQSTDSRPSQNTAATVADSSSKRPGFGYSPTEDGGYVLIGLNAPQPALFEDMDMVWGNDNVMEETRRRAMYASISLHELAKQWDVDTAEDWTRIFMPLKTEYFR